MIRSWQVPLVSTSKRYWPCGSVDYPLGGCLVPLRQIIGTHGHTHILLCRGDCVCKGCHTRFSTPHFSHLDLLFYCKTPPPGLQSHKPHSLKKPTLFKKKEDIEGKASIGVSWGMKSSFWLTLHLMEPNCTFLLLFYAIMWFSPQLVGVQT